MEGRGSFLRKLEAQVRNAQRAEVESVYGALLLFHGATQDTFGESGTPAQLMEKYGLNAEKIIEKAKLVISRK